MSLRLIGIDKARRGFALSSKKSIRMGGLLSLLAVVAALPAVAQSANFNPITIAPGFAAAAGVAQGYTGGSYSLASVAPRDRSGNLCVGFADSTPDHILTLQQNFGQLNIQVDSGGNDTTLVIQGPNNGTVRCGDDTGRNKDASIQDSNWSAGTYRVWVGAFDAGARYNYTLRVRE